MMVKSDCVALPSFSRVISALGAACRRCFLLLAATLVLSPLFAADPTVLLFSFFRDNGQDGLYLATSADGLNWRELKAPDKTFLRPTVGGKLMRDPHLCLGPDGTFHLVWTTGWGQPPAIGYASSRDLLQWSPQKSVPVMSHEPAAKNAWAPELFYDAAKQQFLVFWSSTIPGRFAETEKTADKGWNHRIYYCTTKDFETFTPTKLFYNDGFNVIDATLLQTGAQYRLIVKDETLVPPKKHLRIALSSNPEGPYSAASPPFTGDWVEGPSAIKIGDEWLVYFDHYASPQYYGAIKTRDFQTWQDVSKQLTLPAGTRHGTVLRVSEKIVKTLQAIRQ